MYCPKCGKELVSTKSGWLCENGNMYLSKHLAERLNRCFILKSESPKDLKFSFIIGGNWFCPYDATKMIEESGYVKCLECKISLNEFIHHLVELHPHKSHEN